MPRSKNPHPQRQPGQIGGTPGQAPGWRASSVRGGNSRQADGLDKTDRQGLAYWYEAYLESLAIRNMAAHTINGRRLALIAFLRWCQDRDLYRPQEITRPILESYQRWLFRYRKPNGNPIGFSTQQGRMVTLKDYFRWLTRQNILGSNPASDLDPSRPEHKLPQATLEPSEIERILAQPDVSQPLGLRDRAILETFYSTAIRRTELVKLQLHDLVRERSVLFIRQGKGKKDRVVPIGTRALAWILRYLNEVRPHLLRAHQETALFISGYGDSPLSPDHLSRLVAAYIRQAGIKFGGCHMFRHSCATHMLENGADIRFIQQLLGHAHLTTTQIYTEVSIKQLQRVHAMTHPAECPKAHPSSA